MDRLFSAYRRAYAGLPREAWLLAGVMFVNRCGTMVLPFLALYLTSERGFTASSAGAMLATYGCGAIVGTYLGGRLTQRFGSVRVAFTGLTLSVPGFLAIPVCSAPAQIVASLLYLSVVFEMMRPALATATSDFTPPELHAKAFALNRLALNLGMSVGPAVGGLLAGIDYRLLFVVNAAFVGLAATALAVSFGLRGSNCDKAESEDEAAPVSPWRDAAYLRFLVLNMIVGAVFFQLLSTLPLYWKEQQGLNEALIGLLFVVNTLVIVAVEMVLTDWAQRFQPLRMVAIGTALICLGLGASPLGDGFGFACVLVLIWTLGEMLAMPFCLAYVAGRGVGRSRAGYFGLFSSSMAASSVIAPLVGTALYEIDPRLPWWSCLALAVVLPVGFWRLAGEKEFSLSPPVIDQGLKGEATPVGGQA